MMLCVCCAQTDMAELKGYTEFMGWTIIKGTDEATPLIGLQRNSTLPAISAIDATTSSNTFTFAWQFVGVPSSQVGCRRSVTDTEFNSQVDQSLGLTAQDLILNCPP